jgi:hypothetical protein
MRECQVQNTTSSVAEVITNTTEQLTTGVNKHKTTDNCTVDEADQLFSLLPELVNQKFKAWYCKQFYKMNRTKVMELAALATADGKDPRKLFSFLLKNA